VAEEFGDGDQVDAAADESRRERMAERPAVRHILALAVPDPMIFDMSETIQQHAKQTAEAARKGKQQARACAEASRRRGNDSIARMHENSADRQAETEEAAEGLLATDRRYEGDKLPNR
jgi:Ser-tRNA(Ala) deacylase AlaX